ncbi:MAG TPA: histidine kinase [Verrucomicrobiae bacterium]|jgi:two-component sensor histidine kinase|nr:histidine kinase [Verrucomicrobiae bacterium]
MSSSSAHRKVLWQQRWLIVGVATALSLFFASKDYMEQAARGGMVTPVKDLWWKAMEWYGWALFSPGIFWVCRRTNFRPGIWRAVSIHLLAAAVFATAHCCLVTTSARIEGQVLHTGLSWGWLFRLIFVLYFHDDVLTYVGIASVWHALDFHRQFRQRERQALELETHLAKARLQALKMQLHPHFLFNTLNGIAALTYEDPKGANRMLAKLSELLRMSLDDDGAQEVPLRKELEFNQRYLDLEKIRLGERLTVDLEIEPETLDALTPNLLLQPLVENALRHGIAPFSVPGRLTIRAARQAEKLVLQVADSGPGLAQAEAPGSASGVGLANTRARLQELYGARATLELKNGASGGLEVNMALPFRRQTDAAEGRPLMAYDHSHSHR